MTAHFDHFAPTPPCDDCVMAKTCADLKMLCEAFAAYTYGKPWEGIIRNPSESLFKRMYHLHAPEEYEKLDKYLAQKREKARRTTEERGVRNGRKPKSQCAAA